MSPDSPEFRVNDLAVQAHYKLVERLAESERRFRELVELQQDIVFRCDSKGVLEYVSPAASDLLGLDAAECTGRSLASFLEAGDEEARERLALALGGIPRGSGRRFKFAAADGKTRWLDLQAQTKAEGGAVGTLRDVTEVVLHERERSRLHADLVDSNARLKIESQEREAQAQELRFRYELNSLLNHVTAGLLQVDAGEMDGALTQALAQIGSFVGADRAYVFLFDFESETMSNTHEWCAPGIRSEMAGLQGLPLDVFPWWNARIQACETIQISDLSELPAEAVAERASLGEQGIQSLLAAPLVSMGEAVGFIGFDAVQAPRTWSAQVHGLLRFAGGILLSAIERARAEVLRDESAARYRLLADNSADLIWRTNRDLEFEYLNPAAERMLGYEPQELIGESISTICRPNMVEHLGSFLMVGSQSRAPELEDITEVHSLLHKDGCPLPVETSSSYVLDDEGRVIGLQGTTRDISERAAAEAALEESRTRMDLIVEGIREGIVMVDLEGRIQVANHEVHELLELPKGSLLGDRIEVLLERVTGGEALLSAPLDAPSEEPAEWLVVGPTERVLVVTWSPFLDRAGVVAGRLLLLRDVTHEREVERMKSEFVASVSHELRTPLTSILGFARTLLRSPQLPEEERTEFLGIIRDQSERLHHLIEDILEISRVESGGASLNLEELELPALTNAVVEAHADRAQAAGLELIWSGAAIHGPRLHGDPLRLRSVVENLLGNAIKFTPRAGRIEVTLTRAKAAWVLRVRDSGLGIPKDQVERIFDRFFRVRRPGTEIPGTGLGLAIVHEIVVAHGGSIEVESEPNRGTTFEVRLPDAGKAT